MASFSLTTSLFFTLLLPLLFCLIEAKEFLVGGNSNSWKVPSSSSESLNKWAEANRFQIGDALVWRFDGEKDSVLQVTREDYFSCNTSNPVAVPENNDGTTTVRLGRSGAYYFISGAKGKGACEKGQKVIVVVMARRRYVVLSPSPSPTEAESAAPLPATGGAPRLPVVGWSFAVGVALGITGMVV